MSQAKRQATLFQAWGQKKAKRVFLPGEVIQIDDDDGNNIGGMVPDNEDALLAKALEESLKEYKRCQAERNRELNYVSEDEAPRTSTPVDEPAQQFETLPGFDTFAGQQWIYPTNLPVREYQYNIVHAALYQNTMVILPTGLGKTFIAAVVMYNFYRWYPQGKIIFMAPTKPLVAQQIEACLKIMGISREDTAEMTGTTSPLEREGCWKEKRVFFLTPQVMSNDLIRGICPTERVKLLVVDEAHKAQGNYAYCQVIKEVAKYTQQFRVLALSATPGSDAESVHQVLENLLISHVELRTEECPDIQPYTFKRNVVKFVVPLGEELTTLADNFQAIIQRYIDRLQHRGVWHGPKIATKYQLLLAREQFRKNPPINLGGDQFNFVESDFALTMSLCHAAELLNQHGMRSFYHFLKDTSDGEKSNARTRAELMRCEDFVMIMRNMKDKFGADLDKSTLSIPPESNMEPTHYPVGHPKLEKLLDVVLEHFKRHAALEDPELANTRVMIFSQYRDSVNEITNLLKHQSPIVKVMSFTGQQTTNKRSKGMTQKDQIKVVKEFRGGGYNTLVSTCVGEEGLDIGDVDLIICYDAHKSPVRLIQRMGRTGRKREGRIVMLVTKGKEEQTYNQGQFKKKSIQKIIRQCLDERRLYVANPRMVPKGLEPVCFKMFMTVDDNHGKRNRKGKVSASTPQPKRTLHKYFGENSSRKPDSLAKDKSFDRRVQVDLGAETVGDDARTLSLEPLECPNIELEDKNIGDYAGKKGFKRKVTGRTKAKKRVPLKKPVQTPVVQPKDLCIGETDDEDDVELLVHPFRNVATTESLVQPFTSPVIDKVNVEELQEGEDYEVDLLNDVRTKQFLGSSPVFMPSLVRLEEESSCWVRSPPVSLEAFDPSRDELESLNVQEIIKMAKGKQARKLDKFSIANPLDNQVDVQRGTLTQQIAVVEDSEVFDSVFEDAIIAEKQWESDQWQFVKPDINKKIAEPESIVFQPMWHDRYNGGQENELGLSENMHTVSVFTNSSPKSIKTWKPTKLQNSLHQPDGYSNEACQPIAKKTFTEKHLQTDSFGRMFVKQYAASQNAETDFIAKESTANLLIGWERRNNTMEHHDSVSLHSSSHQSKHHDIAETFNNRKTKPNFEKVIQSNVKYKVPSNIDESFSDMSNTSRYNLTQLVGMVHETSLLKQTQAASLVDCKMLSPRPLSRSLNAQCSQSLFIPESPVHPQSSVVHDISAANVDSAATKGINKQQCTGTKFSIFPDLSDDEDIQEKFAEKSLHIPSQLWDNDSPMQVNCNLNVDNLFDDSSDEAPVTHVFHKSIPKQMFNDPCLESNVSPFSFDLPESNRMFHDICSSTPLPSCKSGLRASVGRCLSIPDSDLRPVRRKRVRILTSPSPSTSKTSSTAEIKQHKQGKRLHHQTRRIINEFVDEEASVSGNDASNISTDESESCLDKYEDSFVDDETGEDSLMAGVYLQSVRSPAHVNQRFKLQYNPKYRGDVFSQMHTASMLSSQYENDSFCVSNEHPVNSDVNITQEDKPPTSNKKLGARKRILNLLSSSDDDIEDNVQIPFVTYRNSINDSVASPVAAEKHVIKSPFVPSPKNWPPNKLSSDGNCFGATPSKPASNSGTVLIASKALNGCQDLVSMLRFCHHVNAVVASFVGCDYIVSNRMAVQRMLISDIASLTNKAHAIERIQVMFELFERSCIILEADKSNDRPRTKHLDALTGSLMQLPVKILYSGSQKESASLLHELMVLEARKNFAIDVDTNLSTKESQMCKFYLKIPGVSYVTALNFCKKFASPQEVANSSINMIETKGFVSHSKAEAIVSFLRKKRKC